MKTLNSKLLLIVSIIMISVSCSSTKWIEGSWTGVGKQIDNKTWEMEFTAKPQADYKINYPGLSCSGNWKVMSKKGNQITFREEITINEMSRCDQGGEIVATKINDNKMELVFYLRSYDPVNPIATATLTKK